MDSLLSIRVFCEVAERASFAAAARNLQLSSAMASKHVSHLERRLGTRLFNRSSRHVSLTEPGAMYLARCRQILSDLDDIEASLSTLATSPRGTLKISAPVWMANPTFVDLLADYQLAFPDVRLDLDLSGRLANLVEEGFDLVLRASPTPGDALIARPIGAVRFHLVASNLYLRRCGFPATPADLTHHRLLAYALHPLDLGRFEPGLGGIELQPILQSSNETLLHLAALRGMGIAFLPQCLTSQDVAAGRLQVVLEKRLHAEIGLYAVYASRRQLSSKVRSFVDFLIADPRLKPGPS